MTVRGMRWGSHLAISLLLFAGSSFSQSNPPNCTTGWDWSYNSLNQNPCAVAAYLESVCFGGLFQIDPLPQGRHYTGPDGGPGNSCQCNTVVYSLVSACAGCQAGQYATWSAWSFNCTSQQLASVSTYPYSIPAGTRVPHWAYLDVATHDNWDQTAAQNAGDSPEGTPSATTGASKSTGTAATSTGSKSNAGPIAGGVVGGIVGLALLSAAVLWYLRHRRWRREAQPSPFMNDEPHVAEAFGLSDAGTDKEFTPRKYYDPSDPTTFPTSFVSPSLTAIATAPGSEQAHGDGTPVLSHDRSQYSGLPLV